MEWTIGEMVIIAVTATQFLKTALNKVTILGRKIKIEKAAAVVLSVVCAAGVVVFAHLKFHVPISLDAIVAWVEVAITANVGYGLIKVARPPANEP